MSATHKSRGPRTILRGRAHLFGVNLLLNKRTSALEYSAFYYFSFGWNGDHGNHSLGHSVARRGKQTRWPKRQLERLCSPEYFRKPRKAWSSFHVGVRHTASASKRNLLRTRLNQQEPSEPESELMKSAFVFVHPLRSHYAAPRFIEATSWVFDVSQVGKSQARGEVFCFCRWCACVCACVRVKAVGCDHGTDVHGRCLWLQAAAPSAGLAPWDSRGFAVLGCGGGEGRAPGVICTVQDVARRCAEGPSPAHRPSSAAKAVADASGGVGAGEAGARLGSGAASSRPPAGQHSGQHQQWRHREQRRSATGSICVATVAFAALKTAVRVLGAVASVQAQALALLLVAQVAWAQGAFLLDEKTLLGVLDDHGHADIVCLVRGASLEVAIVAVLVVGHSALVAAKGWRPRCSRPWDQGGKQHQQRRQKQPGHSGAWPARRSAA